MYCLLSAITLTCRRSVTSSRLSGPYRPQHSKPLCLLLGTFQGHDFIGQFASDGWKSKYAENGVSIVNLCLLNPDGGSTFLGVMKAKGEKKTAEWIANYHREAAIKYTDGEVRHGSNWACLDVVLKGLLFLEMHII